MPLITIFRQVFGIHPHKKMPNWFWLSWAAGEEPGCGYLFRGAPAESERRVSRSQAAQKRITLTGWGGRVRELCNGYRKFQPPVRYTTLRWIPPSQIVKSLPTTDDIPLCNGLRRGKTLIHWTSLFSSSIVWPLKNIFNGSSFVVGSKT